MKRLLHVCKAVANLRKAVPWRQIVPVSLGIIRVCLFGNRKLGKREPQPEWVPGFLCRMEEDCREVMVDCLSGTVDGRGCRITVRDWGAVLNLFRMLNEWYEQGLLLREDGGDEENDPWDDAEPGVWYSVATWLYEFDFCGRPGELVQFAVEARLNPDGSFRGIYSLRRDAYGNEASYFGEEKDVAENELNTLVPELKKLMNAPLNECEFLDWEDAFPQDDD
ncbi:MAG: hypothetical protein LUE13_07980 [Akkermansiaceae bacterium]|nr:hypothetical protein [Akkermansiaceae bacterium]